MRPSKLTLAAFAAAIACIAGGVFAAAHAADLGGPSQKIDAQGNVKPLSWFGGASASVPTSTAVSARQRPIRIDLGSQDYQVGVEAGFDYRLAGPFSIGGLARGDRTNARRLFGTDASYTGI